MAKLQPLIEYQKMDSDLKKMKKAVDEHANFKKLEQAKEEFHSAKKAITDSEDSATRMVTFYENTLSNQPENEKRIDELIKKLAKLSDDEKDYEERKRIVEELSKFNDRYMNLEKRLVDSRKKADGIIDSFKKARTRKNQMYELHGQIKVTTDKLTQSAKPKFDELTKKMAEKKAEIDGSLMNTYNQLSESGIFPPLVSVQVKEGGKSYFCFCGIQLNQSTKAALTQSNLSKCDTCKRMIYIDKK